MPTFGAMPHEPITALSSPSAPNEYETTQMQRMPSKAAPAPMKGELSRSSNGHASDAPSPMFMGLRLWIEQEVDAHVRAAMRDLKPQVTWSGAAGSGAELSSSVRSQLVAQDARQSKLEDMLSTLEFEQRRLASDLRQLQQQISWVAEADVKRHKDLAPSVTDLGVIRDLFGRGGTHVSPEREREKGASPRSRLPGIHAIHLNLADQAKQTRSLGEEMRGLKETVVVLRREVRAAAVATDGARKVAEVLEARFGTGGSGSSNGRSAISQEIEATVEQAMRASWQQLRHEVVSEALSKTKETWGSHCAAIETLREQHQATQQQLSAIMGAPRQGSTTGSEITWGRVLDRVSEVLHERPQFREPASRKYNEPSSGSRGPLTWDAALAEVSARPTGSNCGASPVREHDVGHSAAHLAGHITCGERSLAWTQELSPESHVNSLIEMTERSPPSSILGGDAYATALSHLRAQNDFSAEEREKHEQADEGQLAVSGRVSERNSRQVRQISRRQGGLAFSSDSDSVRDTSERSCLSNSQAAADQMDKLHKSRASPEPARFAVKHLGLTPQSARSRLRQLPRWASQRLNLSSGSDGDEDA